MGGKEKTSPWFEMPIICGANSSLLITAIVMLYRQSELPASFHVRYVINVNS